MLDSIKESKEEHRNKKKTLIFRMIFSKYDQIFSIPEQAKNVKTGWLAYPILINKEANFKRKDFQIFLEREIYKQG